MSATLFLWCQNSFFFIHCSYTDIKTTTFITTTTTINPTDDNIFLYRHSDPVAMTYDNKITDKIYMGDVFELSFELQMTKQCHSTSTGYQYCQILRIGLDSGVWPRLPIIWTVPSDSRIRVHYSAVSGDYDVDYMDNLDIIDGEYHSFYIKYSPDSVYITVDGKVKINKSGRSLPKSFLYQYYTLYARDDTGSFAQPGFIRNLTVKSWNIPPPTAEPTSRQDQVQITTPEPTMDLELFAYSYKDVIEISAGNRVANNIFVGDIMELSFELQLTSRCSAPNDHPYCQLLQIGVSDKAWPRFPLLHTAPFDSAIHVAYETRLSEYSVDIITNVDIYDGNYHTFYFKYSPDSTLIMADDIVKVEKSDSRFISDEYLYKNYSLLASNDFSPYEYYIQPGNIRNLTINSWIIREPTPEPTIDPNLFSFYHDEAIEISHGNVITDNIFLGDIMELSFELKLPAKCDAPTSYPYCHIFKIGIKDEDVPLFPLIYTRSLDSNIWVRYVAVYNEYPVDIIENMNFYDGNYHTFYIKYTPYSTLIMADDVVIVNETIDRIFSDEYLYQNYSLIIADTGGIQTGNIRNLIINSWIIPSNDISGTLEC